MFFRLCFITVALASPSLAVWAEDRFGLGVTAKASPTGADSQSVGRGQASSGSPGGATAYRITSSLLRVAPRTTFNDSQQNLVGEAEDKQFAEKVIDPTVDVARDGALGQHYTELEHRLRELEKEFDAQSELAQAVESAAAQKPTFELGGRVHFDYWDFWNNDPAIGFFENPDPTSADFGTDPDDRLLFRRIRLELEGDIPQNMQWRMQVDFNNPAAAEYKDVYLGWNKLLGNNRLLLGNQKRPLGLDHLNSSRFNVFAERPFVVESFNEDARRIGLCMYGHSDDEVVNYRYGIFNLENTSTTGRYIGDSLQLGGYGRLAATPWWDEVSGGRYYWHTAIAGVVARPDGNVFAGDSNRNEARFRTRPLARSDSRWLNTGRINGADWYEILAFENVFNAGPFQLTGEYMVNFLQRDDAVPGSGQDLVFHGFYVYAAYFLTGEHMPFSRTSGTLSRVKPFENFFLVDRLRGRSTGYGLGAWQIKARYDYIDLSDEDVLGGEAQSATFGLNWHWNAYSRLQLDIINGRIVDRAPVAGFTSGDYWIYGMRFACDF